MRAAPYAGFRHTSLTVPLQQWAFLAERFRKAVRKQPEVARLRRILRGIGGEMLVPAPGDLDDDIPALLRQGRVMEGPILAHEMEPSRCHENLARLWHQRFDGLTNICTGYALSEDGLWRQHSWGLSETRIVETTVLRQRYFGITFPADITDAIACRILDGGGPE